MSKVKICGLSRIEDIRAVNRVLPDYVGFVFAPSKRRVDSKAAAMLKDRLDPRIKSVGVFVNEDMGAVIAAVDSGIVDFVQLHGDEGDEYIKRLKGSCGCPVIKAVSVGGALPLLPNEPDYLLFDALSFMRGGGGRVFDWNALDRYCGLPYFLSGGLSIGNVSDAIKRFAPFGVDVSSGVETYGVKDEKKIERFVSLVRGDSI